MSPNPGFQLLGTASPLGASAIIVFAHRPPLGGQGDQGVISEVKKRERLAYHYGRVFDILPCRASSMH